jgi:hypothetical protein
VLYVLIERDDHHVAIVLENAVRNSAAAAAGRNELCSETSAHGHGHVMIESIGRHLIKP